jgi:hypothetical protein
VALCVRTPAYLHNEESASRPPKDPGEKGQQDSRSPSTLADLRPAKVWLYRGEKPLSRPRYNFCRRILSAPFFRRIYLAVANLNLAAGATARGKLLWPNNDADGRNNVRDRRQLLAAHCSSRYHSK